MTPPSELDTAPQPNLDPALHAGPSMFSGTAGSENSDEDDLPDDVEMGLFDHLEELRIRIFYSLIAVLTATIGCFAVVDQIVVLLQQPAQGVKFVQLAPGEYFFVSVKVAVYSGLLMATWPGNSSIRPGELLIAGLLVLLLVQGFAVIFKPDSPRP